MRKGLLLSAAWTLFGIAASALFLGYWPLLAGELDLLRSDVSEARSETLDHMLFTLFCTLVAAIASIMGMLFRRTALRSN
jgi:hypothetical protein